MIVGLVSSYREGRLVRGAIETALEGCDTVLVFDGPVGEPMDESVGEESWLDRLPPSVVVKRDAWASDASKRTAMVRWAQDRYGAQLVRSGQLWGVWIDGDELLENARYLPDYIARVEAQGANVGGWTIRIVELQDGSVARAPCRVFRIDAIDHFVHGAYQVKTKGSEIVLSLGNRVESEEEWRADRRGHESQMFLRPPLPGEPYIVHRAFLRPDADTRPRLHKVEADEASAELLKFGMRS